jgi:hypothetical protein
MSQPAHNVRSYPRYPLPEKDSIFHPGPGRRPGVQSGATARGEAAPLDFLKLAVPALTQYQGSHGQCPAPEVPETIAQTELWESFLKQRDQILKDKWNSSRDAGYDIGMERAIREWLQRNYLVWAPEDVEESEPPESAPPTPPQQPEFSCCNPPRPGA